MSLWDTLGLAGRKVLLLHHDDLGFTLSTNLAYERLGFPSGSIMMTGSWAPHIRNGDLGVHLTLTSEMDYPRMRSITARKSLLDSEGYLWRTLQEAWTHIDAQDAEAELRAQIDVFYARRLQPTHIDTHMGAVLRPDIADIYHRLALEYQLPCLLPETAGDIPLPPEMRASYQSLLDTTPLPKMRLIDSYDAPIEDRTEWYEEVLRSQLPGVYHLRHHAALPSDETEMLPDAAKRIGDYAALQSERVRRAISEFTIVTFREIGDAWRQTVPP